MNVLEIVVLIITILLILTGFRSGFVRKLASLLSVVLSIVLVSAALPYVTSFLKDHTPVYDFVVAQCEQFADEKLGGIFPSDETQSTRSAVSGLSREEVKALLEEYGYDEYASEVDSLSDEELEALEEQYLGGTDTASSDTADAEEQQQIIDSLPLPEAVQDLLNNSNNLEGYASLQVSNFREFVIHFIASLILNVISFIVAVILVQILLRLAIALLDALVHFPVVGFVNRLAGGALGIVEALFLLWLFFLILTPLQATTAGSALLSMVKESSILNWLYESNLFLRIVMAAMSAVTS